MAVVLKYITMNKNSSNKQYINSGLKKCGGVFVSLSDFRSGGRTNRSRGSVERGQGCFIAVLFL